MRNRVGKFNISEEIILHDPKEVMELMKNVIVTRCEFDWYKREFEYIGISMAFDEIKEGQKAKEYTALATQHFYEDGTKETVYKFV